MGRLSDREGDYLRDREIMKETGLVVIIVRGVMTRSTHFRSCVPHS